MTFSGSDIGSFDTALILEVLGQPPISFHPCYVPIVKSVTAALWLSYAVFHLIDTDLGQDAWFSKTLKEWEQETGLSRREQQSARRKLESLGILECRRPGLQLPLQYRINMQRLQLLLETQAKINWPDLPTTPCKH
jgi:hypothetical protein